MPAELPEKAIEAANDAIAFAKQVRKVNARRTAKTSESRAVEIEIAQTRLREAMAPLRSAIGKFPYGPQTTVAERNRTTIRETSQAIQRERRKLHKMVAR